MILTYATTAIDLNFMFYVHSRVEVSVATNHCNRALMHCAIIVASDDINISVWRRSIRLYC